MESRCANELPSPKLISLSASKTPCDGGAGLHTQKPSQRPRTLTMLIAFCIGTIFGALILHVGQTSLHVRTQQSLKFQAEPDDAPETLEHLSDVLLTLSAGERFGSLMRDADEWVRAMRNKSVVELVEARCGRHPSVRFSDGGEACALHRANQEQLQGEVYSYYLARLLGIDNVPPVSLSTPETWHNVRQLAGKKPWKAGRPVVLTPFLADLEPVPMPEIFRNGQVYGASNETLSNFTAAKISPQWSDLVVFDYLTANLDRAVNNLFNSQWNSETMFSHTHNLYKSSAGKLVFLDNESGLLHGYRLLDRYEQLHRHFLNRTCLFNRGTVQSLLKHAKWLPERLVNSVRAQEPLHALVGDLPKNIRERLRERASTVVDHLTSCHRRK